MYSHYYLQLCYWIITKCMYTSVSLHGSDTLRQKYVHVCVPSLWGSTRSDENIITAGVILNSICWDKVQVPLRSWVQGSILTNTCISSHASCPFVTMKAKTSWHAMPAGDKGRVLRKHTHTSGNRIMSFKVLIIVNWVKSGCVPFYWLSVF